MTQGSQSLTLGLTLIAAPQLVSDARRKRLGYRKTHNEIRLPPTV